MRLLLATLAATAYAQNAKLVIVAQFKKSLDILQQAVLATVFARNAFFQQVLQRGTESIGSKEERYRAG